MTIRVNYITVWWFLCLPDYFLKFFHVYPLFCKTVSHHSLEFHFFLIRMRCSIILGYGSDWSLEITLMKAWKLFYGCLNLMSVSLFEELYWVVIRVVYRFNVLVRRCLSRILSASSPLFRGTLEYRIKRGTLLLLGIWFHPSTKLRENGHLGI